jgi:hypothetical protein
MKQAIGSSLLRKGNDARNQGVKGFQSYVLEVQKFIFPSHQIQTVFRDFIPTETENSQNATRFYFQVNKSSRWS